MSPHGAPVGHEPSPTQADNQVESEAPGLINVRTSPADLGSNMSPLHTTTERNAQVLENEEKPSRIDAADYANDSLRAFTRAFDKAQKSTSMADEKSSKLDTPASMDDRSDLSKHLGKLQVDFRHQKGWEKSDRSTIDAVLDQDTLGILSKWIKQGLVSEVSGCISTGKEANVYHALSAAPQDSGPAAILQQCAIKIQRSRVVSFLDREKYVTGDHRFQKGHSQGNNRAKARLWADKEYRNLKRVFNADIPCPKPLSLDKHVILMSFVGDENGDAAPKLKDIEFDDSVEDNENDTKVEDKWRDLYLQTLSYMRIMYIKCRLVHADFSEYNILFHQDKLWIIDVSQAVEHDHPKSLEFLRTDIKNVNDFFERKGVNTLTDRTLFEFITSGTGPKEKAAIEKAVREAFDIRDGEHEDDEAEKQVSNAVFRQQFIPQNLEQVYDIENDAAQIRDQGKDSLVYQDLLADKLGIRESEQLAGDSDSADKGVQLDDEGQSSALGGEGDPDSSLTEAKRPRGKRFEDKDAKKEHKKQVKEENREKREKKMPKHVKKRLMNTSARRKG